MAGAKKKDKPHLKQPAIGVPVGKDKKPFPGAPTTDDSPALISWRFSLLEFDGPWGASGITLEKLVEVHGKLAEYEKKTWAEVEKWKGQGIKPIPLHRLCKQARKRLEDLRYDDVDNLYELHLTGKERLWGIRIGNVFYILWWDPEHEVCPSTKA